MSNEFRLPDLGEGVHEGQVLRLCVAEGDTVSEDQLLMEVETDKAAVEIPSPHGGTVAKWHVAEKQMVNVGDLMVTFGSEIRDQRSEIRDQRSEIRGGSNGEGASTPGATGVSTGPGAPARSGRRKPASPAVRKLARARNVDIDTIEGSGAGGRVLRADVERAAAQGTVPRTADPRSVPVPVSVSVPAPPPVPLPAEIPDGTDSTDDVYGPIRRVAIGITRKHIAEVMTHAAQSIPHVTDCDDADVTALNELRKGYNLTASNKLGMLPFVIRAVAIALTRHPLFNAGYDAETLEIVYRRRVSIAVGVQTERGLVAPVVRDADRMSVREIDQSLAALVTKARDGRLSREDNAGATYTISNAGAMGGSRYSTPIITPGQVAVLAIGMSRMQAWCVGGEIAARLIMPLSHSMDHRVIDGAREIAFMQDVIGMLEHPGRLLI